MANLYVISKICDKNGNNKTDKESLGRLDRLMSISIDDIKVGERLFLECVQPGWFKSIITSRVVSYSPTDEGLMIETENSQYYLKYVRKDGKVRLD